MYVIIFNIIFFYKNGVFPRIRSIQRVLKVAYLYLQYKKAADVIGPRSLYYFGIDARIKCRRVSYYGGRVLGSLWVVINVVDENIFNKKNNFLKKKTLNNNITSVLLRRRK